LQIKDKRVQRGFRLCTDGNARLCVDRVKRVSHYSESEIILALSSGELRVCGSGLRMRSFFGNEIEISGQISALELPPCAESEEGGK